MTRKNSTRQTPPAQSTLPNNSNPPTQPYDQSSQPQQSFDSPESIQYYLSRHPSLTLLSPTPKQRTHLIPAAHGFAFPLAHKKSFRIIDLHGKQVVDLMSWVAPYSPSTKAEHFSASYTRYRLGNLACPQVGESLYSNHDRALLKLTQDTVRTHDLLFMACNPGFYARQPRNRPNARPEESDAVAEADTATRPHQRSCATNVATAMASFGMGHWTQVHDPFNVFQNTPYYTLKGDLNTSKPRDYCQFECLVPEGLVVALSCCPFVGEGFNGGKVTDVAVVWEI